MFQRGLAAAMRYYISFNGVGKPRSDHLLVMQQSLVHTSTDSKVSASCIISFIPRDHHHHVSLSITEIRSSVLSSPSAIPFIFPATERG